MNENTSTIDVNNKVVVDISRFEKLIKSEIEINILREYFSRNRYVSEEVVRFILRTPEPPKEDIKDE